jgi:3-hydroxyisobutyrate dehydrogenase-like beta-hydroxyacid dehydrogenase
MSITVAVIGAGRMGSVVSRQLPPDTKKIIIDSDLAKASELARSIGGSFSSALEYARDADLIALVLPTPAVNETVEKLQVLVKKGTVIMNMATTAQIDPVVLAKNPDAFIVDAKIIGHAQSISHGEPGIIVVKTQNAEVLALIKSQLTGFTDVVRGDADVVSVINAIGSAEGIKTAVAIRKQLRAMEIPDEWIHVVIRTVCAGTMKSFTEDDLGYFARELLRTLESEGQ